MLTEYEEHRLRENFRLGRTLYRVHASFDLLAIDVGIEGLKLRLKEFGEVITYLPSADSSADDRIDLDILLFDNQTVGERSLKIPHPEMHKRRFVLLPLSELAPHVTHPQLGTTMSELLGGLKDPKKVMLMRP